MTTKTKIELCSKCGQELKEGQIVTGQSWNGDGGEHVNCPVAIHKTSILTFTGREYSHEIR